MLLAPRLRSAALHSQASRSRKLCVVASMPRATFNGKTVAEGLTQMVEGNLYFPPSTLKKEYFEPSNTTTVCGWKGTAKYYNVNVDGQVSKDAAWYYDSPKKAAAGIKDHVAFYTNKVKVSVDP